MDVDGARNLRGGRPSADQAVTSLSALQTNLQQRSSRGSRLSNDGSMAQGSMAHQTAERSKVIVDKDAGQSNIAQFQENIQQTVTNAINSVDSNAVIKITSNLYEEKIVVKKPGLELLPKERGGEVTI